MQTDGTAERSLGVILVSVSALFFGLAGVLTKSIHADPMTIVCWRGLVGALLISVYVLWRRRRGGRNAALRLGWRGWVIVLVGALASVAFISAFKYSYVANVTIIYSTVPFLAALVASPLIGERMKSRTAVAAGLSVIGVGVVVASGLHGNGLLGDLMALAMTALSAVYIALIRKFRDAPVVWAGAVSAFVLFGLGWLVTDPLAITGRDAALLVLFGCTFAFAVVLWTEGSRLVPAAESALLGLLEVPWGILTAWLMLSEAPPAASLAGGAIVMAAVVWHAARDLREARAARAVIALEKI
jgi:drug/metabolite transporter (DMT)-like permease